MLQVLAKVGSPAVLVRTPGLVTAVSSSLTADEGLSLWDLLRTGVGMRFAGETDTVALPVVSAPENGVAYVAVTSPRPARLPRPAFLHGRPRRPRSRPSIFVLRRPPSAVCGCGLRLPGCRPRNGSYHLADPCLLRSLRWSTGGGPTISPAQPGAWWCRSMPAPSFSEGLVAKSTGAVLAVVPSARRGGACRGPRAFRREGGAAPGLGDAAFRTRVSERRDHGAPVMPGTGSARTSRGAVVVASARSVSQRVSPSSVEPITVVPGEEVGFDPAHQRLGRGGLSPDRPGRGAW